MSDTIISIYLFVGIGWTVTMLFHSALRHRRIVSILTWWTFIGVLISTVGWVLMLGTFTPSASGYSRTATDLYNLFAWGGIALPKYSDLLNAFNTLGIVINAMGLGVLVMVVLSGFFPRTFLAGKPRNLTKSSFPGNRQA